MYYQSLMSIKENLSSNGEGVTRILESLDKWLISLSSQGLERINPYQFSLDYDYNERDVLRIFLQGSKENLFRIIYEVRNDEDEYIGQITEEQYRKLIVDEDPLFLYSRYSDEECEFFPHNVEIWFSINMKPIDIPEVISSPKKAVASPLTGDDKNSDLFRDLMGR
ncbi:hypothetical protein ACOMOD_000457 [Enterococcus faecalis]|uniref:hypothetical protein n=1 Tax=Enterococcus faecalis TaxID=1351 RepID=UPI000DE80E11|nr:hypothetical protein [Enterococcus faecalis]EGO2727261.1 hypothetical protein [Enterococcus faecalis]EHB6415822.1 hypothetical protein [Enterococcus faecalis]EHG5940164.1 hypothetical protein [Enterococcus faecalis]EHV0179325.1 hypothetical protein [Enterococcus faecalis]EHZ2983920.1 hypothetical protein [Enterococcus faecalis]